MDSVENVKELTLVLMDTLDLDVVESINWDDDSSLFLDPCGETNFVLGFDSSKLLDEIWVLFVSTELAEVVKVADPLVNRADSVADEVRKGSVAAMDPASWSYSVCLVLNFLGVKRFKF